MDAWGKNYKDINCPCFSFVSWYRQFNIHCLCHSVFSNVNFIPWNWTNLFNTLTLNYSQNDCPTSYDLSSHSTLVLDFSRWHHMIWAPTNTLNSNFSKHFFISMIHFFFLSNLRPHTDFRSIWFVPNRRVVAYNCFLNIIKFI